MLWSNIKQITPVDFRDFDVSSNNPLLTNTVSLYFDRFNITLSCFIVYYYYVYYFYYSCC